VGFLQEFKEFAMRGNVVDLAVGVVIGGAFGKIVSSLVADIVMPVVGVLAGQVNFTDLKVILFPAVNGKAEVALLYGNFLQTMFDFLIVAFAIFTIIQLMNKMQKSTAKQAEVAPVAPPEPPKEQVLLTEIRDLLASKA
jgi:large conductance mechanosensitive channel